MAELSQQADGTLVNVCCVFGTLKGLQSFCSLSARADSCFLDVVSRVSCGIHSARNQAPRGFCPIRKRGNNCSDRLISSVSVPWSVHALGRQSRAHQGHSIRYNYNYALRAFLYCTKMSMLISGLIPCALRMLLPAETIVGAAIGPHAAGRQVASLGGLVISTCPHARPASRRPDRGTAHPPYLTLTLTRYGIDYHGILGATHRLPRNPRRDAR